MFSYAVGSWNIPYDFNDADFEVCENILRIYLAEYPTTPWDALKYLIAQVNYGALLCYQHARKVWF